MKTPSTDLWRHAHVHICACMVTHIHMCKHTQRTQANSTHTWKEKHKQFIDLTCGSRLLYGLCSVLSTSQISTHLILVASQSNAEATATLSLSSLRDE